ncbi:MAG: type II toxin-antitoxin system PemK/MazF family toxin [Acidobacteria bacterium]|nr:type II toxin-antitoxin system PemK/MazF family toxin [Acidobacteriota bacterium]MBS1864438.1 type II toxin-antitoxin system PemK/MazF family toxin [Acidobacteriota bacterium]
MAAPPANWYPRRGEVYIVELDKPRPGIILSVDALNKFALDVCLVPLTTVQHRNFSVRVPVKKGDANLHFDCWAKCDQVNTLEKSFLRYPALGTLYTQTMASVEEQVRICLGLV